MARASPQSGKLVMAACQEAGDRCAATLTGLCRPVMCSDEKHGDNQAWELGQVTLGNRPGYSRYPIAGSISPCCPRCLGEGKVVSGRAPSHRWEWRMGVSQRQYLATWGSRGRGSHFIGRAEKVGGNDRDSRAPPTRAF